MAQSHGMELAPSRNLPQCPAEQSQAQLCWEKLQDHRNWAPAPGTRIPGEGGGAGCRDSWGWDSSRPRGCSRCVPAAGTARAGGCSPLVVLAPARTWHRPGCPGNISLGTAPEQPRVWGGSPGHSQGSVQFLHSLTLVPARPQNCPALLNSACHKGSPQ